MEMIKILKACSKCGRVHEYGKCPYTVDTVRRRYTRTDINKFRSSALWQRKRKEILERDFNLCLVCLSEGMINRNNLEVHHIVSIKQDWDKRLDNDNLITLCAFHHQKAHAKDLKELLHDVKKHPPYQLL